MESYLVPRLSGRRVLLAVSGGIAAYKAAELCRLLVRAEASVQVMMTEAARRFVAPLTFSALSGRPVACELFEPGQEEQIGHIALADEAELLVAAPATADLMARMAQGLAGDLVSTVHLAFRGPVLLAPAMNVNMWQHPATRSNLASLLERGYRVVGPGSGEMACGHVGEGRMAEPEEILQAVGACLTPQDLAGMRVLVTGGGTREALDPVRFLGNRSSGRMGLALAAEAASRGAAVTLICGPTHLPSPLGVDRVDVTSAAEMAAAVEQRVEACDLVVMAAAVADYRPAQPSAVKIKKEDAGGRLTLELERTQDILAALGRRSPRPRLVGFAAETADRAALDALARTKLQAKGCDLLVANDVRASDAGFDAATNRVVLYTPGGGREEHPLLDKRQVARVILDRFCAAK